MTLSRLPGLVALSLPLLSTLPAHAQVTAAINFDTTAISTVDFNSTRGFEFHVTAPLTVTGLSFYDFGSDGLAQSHDVGLWSSAGTLLASTTIPSGTAAPLDSSGKFRYVLLNTPIVLPVGNSYKTGGQFLAGSTDIPFFNQTNLTSAPGVTYVQAAFTFSNSLSNPIFSLPSGLAGGSFVMGTSSAAPEPGTLVFLALGGTLTLARRKRRALSL